MSRRGRTDDDWDEDDYDADYPDVGDDDDEADVKPCPYCRREIHEDAERCPYCENYISKEETFDPKPRWILLTGVLCLIIALLWALRG